jgi:hypothetical protein
MREWLYVFCNVMLKHFPHAGALMGERFVCEVLELTWTVRVRRAICSLAHGFPRHN